MPRAANAGAFPGMPVSRARMMGAVRAVATDGMGNAAVGMMGRMMGAAVAGRIIYSQRLDPAPGRGPPEKGWRA